MEVPSKFCEFVQCLCVKLFQNENRSQNRLSIQSAEKNHCARCKHLNLFEELEMPLTDFIVRTYSRTTLDRFINSSGFIKGPGWVQYEHTKNRAEVMRIRDFYIDWHKDIAITGIVFIINMWLECSIIRATKHGRIFKEARQKFLMLYHPVKVRHWLCRHVRFAETGLLNDYLFVLRESKSNKSVDYSS